jgi:hypothetical protein
MMCDVEVAWLNPDDDVSSLRWCSTLGSSSRARFGSAVRGINAGGLSVFSW